MNHRKSAQAMMSLILLFALLMLLPDVYIYLLHIRHIGGSLLLRMLWWTPSLIILCVLLSSMPHSAGAMPSVWNSGSLTVWILGLGLGKWLFVPFSLLGLLSGWISRGHVPATPFLWTGLAAGLITLSLMLVGRFWGIHHFQVRSVAVRIQDLPEGFRGYRIVQLSDLHSGSFQGRQEDLRKMVEKVNRLQPDLVVFTGDLVNAHHSEAVAVKDILSAIKARDGVYSVLGNHDYGTYHNWSSPREEAQNLELLKQTEKEMGWRLLNNENVILRHDGDSIALVGVENSGRPPFMDRGDLEKALKGCGGMVQILLSHDPTHWEREVLPKSGIALTLSGHTHATQFRLGSLSPARWVYRQWAGLYQKDGQQIYVHSGIGYVGVPLRLGAWPEITLLTLSE